MSLLRVQARQSTLRLSSTCRWHLMTSMVTVMLAVLIGFVAGYIVIRIWPVVVASPDLGRQGSTSRQGGGSRAAPGGPDSWRGPELN